jgi:hypothetical protein
MSEEEPFPRRLTLKPTEVEPVDKVSRPGDGTAISVKLIHRENQLASERPPGAWPGDPAPHSAGAGDPSIFKMPEITLTDTPAQLGDGEAITVHAMLNRNHSAARDSEPELIAMPPRRKSRRRRDLALVMGVAVVSAGVLAAVFRHDTQVVGLALFGIVFVTVILVFIMYGVMDRY